MKYDIFISYARKDFEEVNRFVGMLKERIPTLTYWFDITGIESGDEFEDKIITAIDNSAYVLFALSDHSIQSQWTKDEVMYAQNSKKKVIPLLLKGAELKGWFLFKFGRIDYIDTTNPLHIEKLVKNLSDWTGKAMAVANSLKIKTTPSELRAQAKLEKVKTDLHEAVDLGLSVKWATCNVGASKPEDYGDYFAWGETEPKHYYNWQQYKWCSSSKNSMAKYCMDKKFGAVDNKTVLDSEDDVVHVKWGDNWRMPTECEIKELIEKCTWKWITQNGVNGYLVTGPNGNNIFLPAAGRSYGTTIGGGHGYGGSYWSASLYEDNSGEAYHLDVGNGCRSSNRYYGYTVRPVTDVVLNDNEDREVYKKCKIEEQKNIEKDTTSQFRNNELQDEALVIENQPSVISLDVTTYPPGAIVRVDGNKIGITPVKGIEVPRGKHKVNVSMRGYKVRNFTRTFDNKPVVLKVELEKKETLQSLVNTSSTSIVSSSSTANTSANKIDEHEYVDLGLSVKWATCNVGASAMEEKGIAIANSKLKDLRLPTNEEFRELIDRCTWGWTSKGGYEGYNVSGPNGNSIFLPTNRKKNDFSSVGLYASSNLSAGYYGDERWCLYFDSLGLTLLHDERIWINFHVRCVIGLDSQTKLDKFFERFFFNYKLYPNCVLATKVNRCCANALKATFLAGIWLSISCIYACIIDVSMFELGLMSGGTLLTFVSWNLNNFKNKLSDYIAAKKELR